MPRHWLCSILYATALALVSQASYIRARTHQRQFSSCMQGLLQDDASQCPHQKQFSSCRQGLLQDDTSQYSVHIKSSLAVAGRGCCRLMLVNLHFKSSLAVAGRGCCRMMLVNVHIKSRTKWCSFPLFAWIILSATATTKFRYGVCMSTTRIILLPKFIR